MKGILLSAQSMHRIRLTRFTFLLGSLFFSFLLNAQSKNALSFDGSTGRVDLPAAVATSLNSYTKEAWVYSQEDNGAFGNNNIISGSGTAFWFPGSQGFKLTAGHFTTGNSFVDVQDPTPLVANKWYHVAVTYDAATTTMSLYKNGILVASNSSIPNQAETELHIGSYQTSALMRGFIDEVRIWSVALSQSEIRDWMCRKVTSSHPQYANLLAYYKADDGTGTNLVDSKNTNDGTLVGGTTWAVSGASIGDASAYDYTNATKTANLSTLSTGETFTVTSATGAPDGIQVYRVDAVPDNTTGLSGIGGNTTYFGVFQVGGSSPTYDAVYDYGTHWGGVVAKYRLYKRADNSAASWADAGAVQNVPANTLTVTGQSTEYMLGSVGFPLPVNFTSFLVSKDKSGVKLMWSTAQEINNSGFAVQRSSDKGKNWTDLGFVAGNNNASGEKSYSFVDGNPVTGLNLYRLKQMDNDGSFNLSEIKAITFLTNSGITVYPVPASNEVFIDLGRTLLLNTTMKVFDQQGKEVKRVLLSQLQQRLPINDLQSGIYILQFADGSTSKFVKQ